MRDVRPRSVRRRPPDEPEEADSGERHQHRGGSDAVLSICSTNRSNCRCPQPCWFEGLVDVGSPATSNPVVVPRSARRPGEQTGLHVGTARVVAEDRRSARGAFLLIRPGGPIRKPTGPVDRGRPRGASFESRIRAPAGAADVRAGASGADRAAASRHGRSDIRRLGGWPPLVTSRAEGVQLAAGPGRRRRPTGSPPGCRSARSPARRRS